ncbi:MAG: hypothetical protein V4646_04860 [Pseudomonadota bacterium]
MESGIKRSQRDYTLAFKLLVVEQAQAGLGRDALFDVLRQARSSAEGQFNTRK